MKIALDYFQRAIDIDPDYALAYSGLADTYRLMDQYAGASDYRIVPKARAAAEKALELDDSLAEVHTSIGGVLMDEEKYIEAKGAFDRAIELNPNYLLAYHWGSINLAYMGDPEEYISLAKKALELDPRSPIISSNLSGAYREIGRIDKAIQEHEKNLELNPDHPSPYIEYGVTLSLLGDFEKAIDMGKRGMAIDSLSLNNNIRMGEIYRKAGLYDEAIGLYQRMMDFNPELALAAHREMGLMYRYKGDFENAIAHFRKAIEIDPIDVDSYQYLGNFYRIIGEYEKSLTQFKRIVDLEPQLPGNYWNYGHALHIIDDHENAIEQLRKAAELDPSFLLQLGMSYFYARDFDKAYETLKKVIEVMPKNVYALFTLWYIDLSQDRYADGVPYIKQFSEVIDSPNRDKIYAEAFPDGVIDEMSAKNYIEGFRQQFQKRELALTQPLLMAILYTFFDYSDSAFVMLEKAFDTQDLSLALNIQSAFFDKLRSDPRYEVLIKKLKLEKYLKPLE